MRTASAKRKIENETRKIKKGKRPTVICIIIMQIWCLSLVVVARCRFSSFTQHRLELTTRSMSHTIFSLYSTSFFNFNFQFCSAHFRALYQVTTYSFVFHFFSRNFPPSSVYIIFYLLEKIHWGRHGGGKDDDDFRNRNEWQKSGKKTQRRWRKWKYLSCVLSERSKGVEMCCRNQLAIDSNSQRFKKEKKKRRGKIKLSQARKRKW